MNLASIISIFDKIQHLKVGVIGDFAVDFYIEVQKQTGEFSLETQQEVHWGSQPRTSLGGAGNVVQNLATLGVGQIKVFGCVGNDLFGREMKHLLQQIEADCSHLHIISTGWDTCTYTKPMYKGHEQNRLDIGTHNTLPNATFEALLSDLDSVLPTLNVLIINQQFPKPLLNETRTKQLNQLIKKHPNCFYIADMRDVGQWIRGAILKVNTNELANMLGVETIDAATVEECIAHGKALHKLMESPVLITRGEHGILYVDSERIEAVEAVPLNGELDTVGAGDTVVAAFATTIGANATVNQALTIANLAAAVTVQKLQQTGTASLEEILQVYNQL